MKAFLLAAGHGTRLRPLTDALPKCLLPVQGTPILEIWLNSCSRFGIDEVLVNIHSHAPLLREFLSLRSKQPTVNVVEEANLLGSAGTLLANRQWVNSEEMFWIFYADVLTNMDFRGMLEIHNSRRPVATLGVYEVPDPRRCGVVSLARDGTIERFIEKPADPTSNLAFSGIMIGTQELFDFLPTQGPSDFGFDVFPRLAHRMIAYRINDYLIDIGTMENYQEAQTSWPGLKGKLLL